MTEEEVWRVIAEAYQYSVSNLGRVKNAKTGRILKPSVNQSGVPMVVLRDAGISICRSVPKLVREAFGR